MIKLKSLLTENVRFENNDTLMVIPTLKGDYRVRVFKFKRNEITKYNYDINSPPDHYENWGGKQPIAVGGTTYLGHSNTNIEQVYAELSTQLKKLGLPYVPSLKLKIIDSDAPERKQFLDTLHAVINDFQKEMQKSENQPKQFGAGPPEYGQWITGDEIRNGRLKWVIDNYGDFYLVIKWNASPRDIMKASEFLKNYDHIISGKKGARDYAREVYIRKDPFHGL